MRTKEEILTDAIGYPKRKDADVREWEHGENVLEAMEAYASQEIAAERSRQEGELLKFAKWAESQFIYDDERDVWISLGADTLSYSDADLLKKYREQNQSK